MNNVNKQVRPPGTVVTNDASLIVWEEPGGKCGLPKGYDKDFRASVLHPLIRFMRSRRWYVHQDPRILKHYNCLKKSHRRCWHPSGLQCKLKQGGRSLEIQFYQNRTKPDNPAGGEYDFHKMERMPYLLRLRTQLEMQEVRAWLVSNFLYTVKPEQRSCGVFELTVDEYLAQHYQVRSFREGRKENHEIHDYNKRCMDGEVKNDERVFFLGSYNIKRWGVGVAEHNINNMWWLKVGQHNIHNVCCAYLSHKVPEEGLRGRRIEDSYRKKRLEGLMLRAAKERRYVDAERMRVALEAGLYVPR